MHLSCIKFRVASVSENTVWYLEIACYQRQTECKNSLGVIRTLGSFRLSKYIGKRLCATERTIVGTAASSTEHNLDHPVAEEWGRLVNRRVLSGCTERADGQYGTTCCPSQRNRDTLSKAGESASRTALKVHFPHVHTRIPASTAHGIAVFSARCTRIRGVVCSAGVPSSTALKRPFSWKVRRVVS